MALNSWEILELIRDCALNGVDHVAPHAINRVCIVPGEIAWDECDCGQLVVSSQRRYPSSSFPTESIDSAAECGEPWIIMDIAVSLARCVPIPDENGNPPLCADLQAAAQQLERDKGMLRKAIGCCLDVAYNEHQIEAYELRDQIDTGPQGGCVETRLNLVVGLTNGCGC